MGQDRGGGRERAPKGRRGHQHGCGEPDGTIGGAEGFVEFGHLGPPESLHHSEQVDETVNDCDRNDEKRRLSLPFSSFDRLKPLMAEREQPLFRGGHVLPPVSCLVGICSEWFGWTCGVGVWS